MKRPRISVPLLGVLALALGLASPWGRTEEATPTPALPESTAEASGGASAPAQESKPERGALAVSPVRIDGSAVLRLMLGAAGLCVLAVVFVTALRRWWPGFAPHPGAAGLQVIARVALSPKHFVCVLRAGDRRIVVGVSGDRMTPLAVQDDPPPPNPSTLGSPDAPAGKRKGDSGYRAVTEADLVPYRRQVSRLREMLRGRVEDLTTGYDAP